MTVYMVTISAGDGGQVSPEGEVAVPAAEDLWMYAAPQAGRKVHDWYHDGQPWGCDVESYVIRGIAKDASVHVTFEPIRLAVTTTPCQGGESSDGTLAPCSSLQDGPILVDHGSALTFRATPAAGFVVDEWSVDGRVVARACAEYTLAGITADHAVRVAFALAPLAPVRWTGTVTVRYTKVDAPPAANSTRRADTVLTQADLDASPVIGPVHPTKGGTERHESTRTEQVAAVVLAGGPDADGLVGTLDLRLHELTRHTRTQQVRFEAPPARGRVTVAEADETYPLDSAQGRAAAALSLLPPNASVEVAWEQGEWVITVRLVPFDLLGERRIATQWRVVGGPAPADPPAQVAGVTLATPAFQRRVRTGNTDPEASRLKGPARGSGTDRSGASVRWDLRLRTG